MSNNDKFRITADLIIAVLSNSNKDTYDRLETIPDTFEKIYNKIDELDKKSMQPSNDDSDDNEPIQVI